MQWSFCDYDFLVAKLIYHVVVFDKLSEAPSQVLAAILRLPACGSGELEAS